MKRYVLESCCTNRRNKVVKGYEGIRKPGSSCPSHEELGGFKQESKS